jgi:uracil-DNA glycosylase
MATIATQTDEKTRTIDKEVFDKFKQRLLNNISDDWLAVLDNPELDEIIPYLIPLDGKLSPPVEQIFEFARLTKKRDICVIVLGQDPYPKAGHAHGLAFSCLVGIPASLRNIYQALYKSKLLSDMPDTGCLKKWAEQGILLLNLALTTITGSSNVHTELWTDYTANLIQELTKKPIIALLWGSNAQSMEEFFGEKCTVMKWAHPSPLAQAKQKFIDCDHFIQVNKLLPKLGYQPINWNPSEADTDIEISLTITKADLDRTIIVFTDGSCEPNKLCPEAHAGYSAVFARGAFQDTVIYGALQNRPHYASNQRAEGYAIFKAFEFANKYQDQIDRIFIMSDSDFWIKMITVYMPKWSDETFSTKQNADLTVPLFDLYNKLIQNEKTIEFRHIPSHNKSGWADRPKHSYEYFCYTNNEMADQFAKYARTHPDIKPGMDIVDKVE